MTAQIIDLSHVRKKKLEAPPNRIREHRERLGITQGELAERIGTVPHQISRLETGDRVLDLPWMQRIASALGLDAGALLNEADNQAIIAETRRKVTSEMQGVLLQVAEGRTAFVGEGEHPRRA